MSATPDESQDDMGSLTESGGRLYSLDGVIERIELAFTAETPPDRLRALVDEADQRAVVHDLTAYVLTTTGLRIGRGDVIRVIDALHALLFRLGPLEPYLSDDTVCDLTIDGAGKTRVRRFGTDWQPAPEHFLDSDQVGRLVQRMAIRAGVPFGVGMAALTEIGAQFLDRPARLSVSAPPISPAVEVAIRLHPATPPTFDTLIAAGTLSTAAGEMIRGAIADRRGLLIAGEPGAGKTMFIQALLPLITADTNNRLILIERAGELRPPPDLSSDKLIARYSAPELVEPIAAALAMLTLSDTPSTWIIVDEVRADEMVDWWTLLTAPHSSPIWAFRSSQHPARLRTALNMTLRQRQSGLPQPQIDRAIQDRLPLVVLLGQRGSRTSKPVVLAIGGWTPDDAGSLALTLSPQE